MANRHSGFYANVKRGTHNETYDDYDDDDYDYDDDYDDDSYYSSKGKGKGGGVVTTKTTSAKQLPPQPKGYQQPSQSDKGRAINMPKEPELDSEILEPVLAQVKAALGAKVNKKVTQDQIKQAIRDNNYDANASVAILLSLDGAHSTQTTATQPKQPVGSAPAVSPAAKQPGKTAGGGGGKSFSLSSPSPQVSENAGTPKFTSPTSENGGGEKPEKKSRQDEPQVKISADAKVTSAVIDKDGKANLNVVLSGHVDSGKSTILGHLLVALGEVEEKVVKKFETQCKSIGKATFQYAWVLDSSEEERRRGVTIDANQQSFTTDSKRVVVVDAPGHKQFVMNMISSATQADVALLVVTCGKGEFEAGLNYGTLEHLMILKTLGVQQIIVAMNKMDAAEWSEERYKECVFQLQAVLKQTRFKESEVRGYCPVSGLTGHNLTPDFPCNEVMPWYTGPTLVELVDKCEPTERMTQYPLRMTVSDVLKSTICGKIEAGRVKRGETIMFVPSGTVVTVKGIDKIGQPGLMTEGVVGEAVEISTSSDITGVFAGCVGCPKKSLCPTGNLFEAHIQTFGTLQKSLIPGSPLMMQLHLVQSGVVIENLISTMTSTGTWSKGFVKCVRKGQQALVLIRMENNQAMELADDVRSLGRFVLRQEGETIGGGFIKRIVGKL